MLQLPVLLLQRPQPLRLAHFHPAVLPLPPVQRLRRDPVLATQLRRRHPSFRLLQDANDLLFVESTLAHDSSSQPWAGHSKWEKSHFDWTNFRGAGQPGLEQKVKDQDQIIQGLKERPPQINMPPAIVNIPSVSAPPATRHAPPVPQPRGLTELQRTILMSDLKEGIGLKVRINSVGKLQDTLDFADELQSVFKGWQIERNMVGALLTNV